jgi:hypothetical protein
MHTRLHFIGKCRRKPAILSVAALSMRCRMGAIARAPGLNGACTQEKEKVLNSTYLAFWRLNLKHCENVSPSASKDD